jgi:hypothetical protein
VRHNKQFYTELYLLRLVRIITTERLSPTQPRRTGAYGVRKHPVPAYLR